MHARTCLRFGAVSSMLVALRMLMASSVSDLGMISALTAAEKMVFLIFDVDNREPAAAYLPRSTLRELDPP